MAEENKLQWTPLKCEYCGKSIEKGGLVASFRVKYTDKFKEGLRIISTQDKVVDLPLHRDCMNEIFFIMGDPGLLPGKKKEFEARIIKMARDYNDRKEGKK